MTIAESRFQAALLSGGVSNDDIHRAAFKAALAVKQDAEAILDYGSGTGGLLPKLQQVFPNAKLSAADILARPIALTDEISWFRGDLNAKVPAVSSSFDLIFAVEVIEHLENPRHMLRDLFRLLKPGGATIVTTPNPASLRSLLSIVFKGYYASFDDQNYPAHITPVTRTDFERMSSEIGFECSFFFTGVGRLPKFLNLKWQALPLLGPRLQGSLFSDNYGVVLRKSAEDGRLE